MAGPVYCNGCGQRLEIPAGFARAKMRCPECGVFTELSKEVREQGQAAEPAVSPEAKPPPPARPQPTPPRAAPQPGPAAQTVQPPPPAPPPIQSELDMLTGGGYGFQAEPTPPAPSPAAPAPAKPPPSRSKAAPAQAPPEREILIQGTEEEDFKPYTVPGDAPTKRCPECEKKIALRDKVCSHCGYNFETGEKSTRTFQSLSYEWENGWALQKRVFVFIVLQVINFVTLAVLMIGGVKGSTPIGMIIFAVFLQAFMCGTYEKLSLSRTQKGKVTMKNQWRVAFVPRPAQIVKWKEYESLTIVQSNETSFLDWAMALILLPYAIVPGVLYWWLVIRPDKFAVMLCRDHGFPEIVIFRALNGERAKEVLQTVCDVTTLPVHQ